MRLIKLLPLILAVCSFSLLFSQNPAQITQYLWNATQDSWQPHVREIHTQPASQQEVVLSQIWDADQRQWRDWTRTTTDFNAAHQAVHSLMEKMQDGDFVPRLKKQFEFNEKGKLTLQTDFLWDTEKELWDNLYKEIRVYDEIPGNCVRTIWKPSQDGREWQEDEFYIIREGAYSVRFSAENGLVAERDKWVSHATDEGKEEILYVSDQKAWSPISKKEITKNKFSSLLSFFEFSEENQGWEQSAFENTYLNADGQIQNIQTNTGGTTFHYDAWGRLLEKVRSRSDAQVSKEVYEYTDDVALLQKASEFDMILFPNPMKEEVNIRFSEWIPGPCVIKVMDLQGKIIRHQSFDSMNALRIDRQGMAAGSYQLQLISSKGVKNRRLLVTD